MLHAIERNLLLKKVYFLSIFFLFRLNLIFNNAGINSIDVNVDFGYQGLLCGTGLATGIHFDTTGQSSMLIYLGDSINKWQILNTGGGIY